MKNKIILGLLIIGISSIVSAQGGWLDNTFNNTGIVITPSQGLDAGGKAVAIQSDGKIVVAGTHDPATGTDVMLVRYNTDGSLDMTFGVSGVTLTNLAASDYTVDVKIQTDGKILVLTRTHLIRYNSNGTLDLTFNSVGWIAFNTSPFNNTAFGIQSTGRIAVATINSGMGMGMESIELKIYNSNGSIFSSASQSFSMGYVLDLVIESTNNIVVFGGSGYTYGFGFNSNGTINFPYGGTGSGKSVFNYQLPDITSADRQSDDKIIAYSQGNLYRLTTTGAFDNTFGTNGMVLAGSFYNYNGELIVQADGKFVLTEEISDDYKIRRFNSDGSFDNTFSSDGMVIIDLASLADKSFGMAIQSNGKYVVTGGSDENFGTIRLNNVCTAVNSTEVITLCGTSSYTWIDGNTYTSSTSGVTHTIIEGAANGCDSIVTLNLTISNPATGIDVQNACDSYTWIDGNTYTSNNNSAQWTLTNTYGCDSTVTLDLTLTNSTTATDFQSACDSYTWIDGNTYTSNNNTAVYIITNAEGCDSLITLDLTITATPTATATDNGNGTITASGSGNYQWIDCDNNNTVILGETSANFAPTNDGNYAVIVDNGNCSDTSTCVVIDYLSLQNDQKASWNLYPNPTEELVYISFEGALANCTLYNALGQVIYTKEIYSGDSINLNKYTNGIYIIELSVNGSVLRKQLVKK